MKGRFNEGLVQTIKHYSQTSSISKPQQTLSNGDAHPNLKPPPFTTTITTVGMFPLLLLYTTTW